MSGLFWRRHKRKVIAATAAGVAGAAAAYYWWYGRDNEADGDQRRRAQPPYTYLGTAAPPWRGPTANPTAPTLAGEAPPESTAAGGGQQQGPAAAGGAGSSLDDSLQAHFSSIQELADRQALEDLLPRLRTMLLQATDYEPLKDQLRDPSLNLSSDAKKALWLQLAFLSFTRTLAACWLVPLLDLLVRLKLHIVGRHMYLESKLPQLQPRSRMGLLSFSNVQMMPPRLSDRAKEEFFRSDYFIEVGAAGLLHKIRQAVDTTLAGIDLGGQLSVSDLESLMATCHATFESSFIRCEDVWHSYLTPPGNQPVSVRTIAGVEAFMAPMEAAMVDELNAELREVLGDYRFVEALRAAVRATSRATATYIQARFIGSTGGTQGKLERSSSTGVVVASGSGRSRRDNGGGGVGVVEVEVEVEVEEVQEVEVVRKPFPYVVPIVAKSCQVLLDETERCTKGISSLREVQALCASVFTFGPHIC